jgi:diaminopimelate epimerase
MVACALISHELHGFASPVSVLVKGGDTLRVGFEKSGEEYRNVTLHGPADFVFEGAVTV